MKLHELALQPIDENAIHKIAMAASVLLGLLSHSPTSSTDDNPIRFHYPVVMDKLVMAVSKKYKVDSLVLKQVVAAARKYEHPDFPTAKDILAVAGVESSFNPDATSRLKQDPARGLMQFRPQVWDIPVEDLNTIDGQIKHGANILRQYYEKLGTREAALHAYNVGITNHKKSLSNPAKGNPRYVPKINKDRSLYD